MKQIAINSSVPSRAIVCFCCALLFALTCRGEGQQPGDRSGELPYSKDRANLPKALTNVRAGSYSPLDIELIARMDATEAVPALEEQFKCAQDADTKGKLANALVRLKDPDDTYWNYLAERASEAINRGEPDPFRYDSNGKVLPDKPSEEFAAWAKRQNLDAKAAYNEIVINDIGSIIDLATSKDQRAIPMLRKALTSQNRMLQVEAANGLADLGDESSVPLIISACAGAPKDFVAAIAEPLVYFDDESAQRAVETYVPPEAANALREKRAQGYGPFD